MGGVCAASTSHSSTVALLRCVNLRGQFLHSGAATSENCVFSVRDCFSTLYSQQESSRIPISPNLVIIIFPFNKISLTATLVSVKWYLVVLVCISPWLIMFNIISCVCEPFWCILWRYFSLFKPFILLYLGHWFAWAVMLLPIFWPGDLYWACDLQIFSTTLWVIFSLAWYVLDMYLMVDFNFGKGQLIFSPFLLLLVILKTLKSIPR